MRFIRPLLFFLVFTVSGFLSLHFMSSLATPAVASVEMAADTASAATSPALADSESGIPTGIADLSSSSGTTTTLESGTWVSLDLPLSDFTDMTSTEHIGQMILSKGTIGPSTVYVDNVYLYNGVTEPTDAPTAPTAAAGDVISIFSDAYTDISGVDYNPNWGQATTYSTENIASNNVIKLAGLNYQGINFDGNQQDVSGHSHVHFDYWSSDITTFKFFLINTDGDTVEFPHEVSPTTTGSWQSVDVALSDFTGIDMTKISQIKIDAQADTDGGTLYLDNIYFYSANARRFYNANPSASATLGVYSETHIQNSINYTISSSSQEGWGSNPVAFDAASSAVTAADGSTSLEVDWQSPTTTNWGGVVLNFTAATDVSSYTDLVLSVNTSQIAGFGDMHVKLEDTTGNSSGHIAYLSNHATGATTSGDWTTYTIPLSAFATPNKTILKSIGLWSPVSGTAIGDQDITGKIYFDNIYFTGGSGGGATEPSDAPTAPTATGTISIYSDAYTDVASNANPGWGESSVDETIASNTVKKSTNFAPFDLNASVDVSGYDSLHVDVWSATGNENILVKLVPPTGDPDRGEQTITSDSITAGAWNSLDFALSSFTGYGSFDLADIKQILIDQTPDATVYFDNIYFYNSGGGGGGATEPSDAPTAPTATGTISIYSDAYTDVASNANPGWGESSVDETIASNTVKKSTNFAPFDLNASVDVSGYDSLHVDVWSATGNENILVKLVPPTGDPDRGEQTITSDSITAGAWNSLDFALSSFTGYGSFDLADIKQILIDQTPDATVYFDNIYFYNSGGGGGGGFDSGLLTNGDFEAGVDPWIGNAANVVDDGGNNVNYANVETAGNPYDVNLAQVMSLTPDETYTLSFKAKGTAGRTMVAGLGLNHDPWTNVTEEVTLSADWQTYSYEFTTTGFGDANSRVLFDMGADTGEIYIDDVSLVVSSGSFDSGLLTNGDFEAGVDPWIGNAANVVDDGGNNVNYANVETAGNPYDVNLAQVMSLTPDETYTLSFKAKGTAGRTMVAGLGLNHDPWTNVTEEVTLSADWQTYSYEFTTTGFGDSNSRVLFDMGADTGEIYIDDVSLIVGSGGETPTEPSAAAPTPTWDDGLVISLFSDAYTDLAGTTWSTTWDDVTLEDVQVDGNDTKKYSNLVFAGIEPASPIDASAMTHIHLDIWTPDDLSNGEEFRVKLVDYGADGAIGGSDDTEHELTFAAETLKVAFDNTTYSVTEGYTATITAILNMASTEPVTVSYSTSDGTATAGTDYTAASGTLVFPAGTTEQSFTVATTNDGDTEGNETITLSLSDAISATIGANGQATLTLNDHDIDQACLSDQALIIDDFENGLPEGDDANGIGIGFATWQDPSSGDVAISTTDSPPAAVPNAGTPNHVVKMDSNIASWGGFSHAFENDGVTEWVNQDWSTYGGFCFWLHGNGTNVDLFVDIIDNRNSSATPPNDGGERWGYGFKDDFTGWKLFTIPFDDFTHKNINNEAPYDGFGREEVHGWAFGSESSNGDQTHYLDRVAVYGTAAQQGVKVQFDSATPQVNEGETATLTVTLNGPFTDTVTVNYRTAESSATADRDYVPVSGTLTFPAGTTEQSVTIDTIDDNKHELDDNERVAVLLTDPSNATLGFLRRTVLTIVDNDAQNPDLLDDFEGYHQFEITGTATLSTVELMSGEANALPGQGTYEQVLSVDYDATGGSFSRMFVESQDWSSKEGISLWYNGTGSGDTMTVELLDNQTATTANTDSSEWVMAWSDEFDGAAGSPPNPNVWTHELGDGALNEIVGWGNNELQYYTDSTDNAAMDGDGNLVLTVSEVDADTTDLVCWYGTCEYTSARLLSWHKTEFKYGRIESRVKVGSGAGLWPAFWTLGTNINEAPWPQSGEIDIMEFVGRKPNEIFGTIHGPGHFGGNSFGGTYTFGEPVPNNYHTFAIEWGPDKIDWYVDGIKYHSAVPANVGTNEWVYNHPFFMLLNVAVGGNFGGAVGDDTTFPQTTHVDYVRVYQAADTAERFEATFTDSAAGWQRIDIPFSSFSRSATQPDGAPNDGFGRTEVSGYGFKMPAGSSGSFLLDSVQSKLNPPFHGVTLSPSDATSSGTITSTVSHELTIINTGNRPDTFNLAISNEGSLNFPTSLSSSSVSLEVGASTTIKVNVTFPDGASNGDSEIAIITATSQNDSSLSASANLTTAVAQDDDGVTDETEGNVPNPNGTGSGDGNGDGIADNQQNNVTSLPNQGSENTGGYVTLASPPGTELVDVQAKPVPEQLPEGIDSLPQGLFDFDINGVTTEPVTIELILHEGDSVPNTYLKQDENTGEWSEFLYDGTTGAVFTTDAFGNTVITLHFVDGQRGDADGIVNGVIADPGAPAIKRSNVTPTPPAMFYDVDVFSTIQSKSGVVGSSVVYEVTVANNGNVADTFNLSLNSAGVWPATISANSVTLNAGESTTVEVQVSIPADASNGTANNVTVTAISQGNANADDSTSLNTTAVATVSYGVQWSTDMAKSGVAGTKVSYSVNLTNTGNTTDTLALAVNGNNWTTTVSPLSVTLGAGASAKVQVEVTIAADGSEESSDTATVMATSQGNSSVSDSINLTTTALPDEDDDGVDDETEANVPNPSGTGTGDGNGDGIPDNEQKNVTSLPNQGSDATGGYVTLASPSGTDLVDVQAQPAPEQMPEGIDSLPQGVFSFDLNGVTTDPVTIELILHEGENVPDTYLKQDENTGEWFEFLYDGTTGAVITTDAFSNTVITLHFVDGERGDADGIVNGIIADPGAPGMKSSDVPSAVTTSDLSIGQTGGFALPLALLGGTLALGLAVASRRRRRTK